MGGVGAPPVSMCQMPGTFGTVLQVDTCPVFSCSNCAMGQTCDTGIGLCQGVPLFSSTQTTAASSATGESWVIPVAVVVPLAVLLGVGAAVLIAYHHRRSAAAYDRTANRELRERNVAEMGGKTDNVAM